MTKCWRPVISLAFIGAFGCVLRLRQFISGRSVWIDEVKVGENFINLGLPEILVSRLSSAQSAPPGWLLATQSAVELLGRSDQVMRLVALLAGLATCGMAVFVARRVLGRGLTQVVFVAMVALSPSLIYYSSEIKQYSSDSLATMSILTMWATRCSPRAPMFWAIGGPLIAISSAPGIIGLVGLAVAVAVEQVRMRNRCAVLGWAADQRVARPELLDQNSAWTRSTWGRILGAWAIAIFLHGIYILYAGTDREFMNYWWTRAGAFPPAGIGKFVEFEWYPLALTRLFWLGIGERTRVGALGDTAPLLITLVSVVFLVAALRDRRDVRLLFGFFIATSWLFAELRVYPSSGRLALYLVPIFLLLLSVGLESMISSCSRVTRLVALVGALSLLSTQVWISVPLFLAPLDDRDMKWLVEEIALNSQAGDVVLAQSHAQPIIDWYVRTYPSWPVPIIGENDGGLPHHFWPDRIWVPSTYRTAKAQELSRSVVASGYIERCAVDEPGLYFALLERSGLSSARASSVGISDCPFTTRR